jgi:hypothetical protein
MIDKLKRRAFVASMLAPAIVGEMPPFPRADERSEKDLERLASAMWKRERKRERNRRNFAMERCAQIYDRTLKWGLWPSDEEIAEFNQCASLAGATFVIAVTEDGRQLHISGRKK